MKNFLDFRAVTQIQRYKKWRALGMRLNHQIMEHVPKDALLQAARDLRLLKKNDCIQYDSESDTCFLMDRMIHDISINGRRVLEIYRDQKAGARTADEGKLLDALAEAAYSLYVVQKIQPGRGLHLLDVFSEGTMLLTDINLSRTAKDGHVLAARTVSLDGIIFTTGCACPFPPEYLPQLKDNFVQLFEKKKHHMTWAEMMRQYNPYFFIHMKKYGVEIDFTDVV